MLRSDHHPHLDSSLNSRCNSCYKYDTQVLSAKFKCKTETFEENTPPIKEEIQIDDLKGGSENLDLQ